MGSYAMDLARGAPRELRPGDRIERYELLHPIARGGMGSVWAARLHGTRGFEKTVAIKTVLPHLETDARVRAMFLDEARLASAIAHRNVAHILDFLECDGALYLVMEWIEGASLKTLEDTLAQHGRRVPTGVLLRVLVDICAGLHAAHELCDAAGVPCELVHRDVSPHNVLVGLDGTAKLIDFGVAKARHRAAHDTTFGALKGKLQFMSPEQARSGEVDRRADIWSVGAVLFFMLAGHGPFEMDERSETLRFLLSGTPTLPLPADVHPAIARVIEGCLAHRPQDRFQSAEELGAALEMAIDEIGISASAADVAEFMRECSITLSAGEVPSAQRVADPFALSFTTDEGETRSYVRPRTRIARRTLVSITLGLLCIAAAAMHQFTQRHLLAAPQASEAPRAPPTLDVSRDEATPPAPPTSDSPTLPAPLPTIAVIQRASLRSPPPLPSSRRIGSASRPDRSISKHLTAPAPPAPSAKRSDDFGSAVETRK
jgi:serine/threonine protein kinase